MNEAKSLDKKLKDMDRPPKDNSFGEVFIYSLIHTIEFALGTVSNTASYLRLWALSLAHGELSETFSNLIFAYAFASDNIAVTVVLGCLLWPFFWSVTFGVIMMLDFLECSLHTLRLHWVEFQNKFYAGDGYSFKPYSFSNILQGVLDEKL